MNPLVSILIPVYQRAELAIEAINSALNQDYKNVEIIVGDNKSTDGTYEVLCERYNSNSKVVLFQNDVNLGPVGNWEACLEKANGDYIKFLWSDDLMRDDFVSKSVELLEKNKKASFAFSAVKIFEDTNDIRDNLYNHTDEEGCYQEFMRDGVYSGLDFIKKACMNKSIPLSPGCAIFRRENMVIVKSIKNSKGYDHRKTGAGTDLLMFFEAVSKGQKFIFFNDLSSFFRKHPESITISSNTIGIGYHTAKLYFLKKHLLDIRFLPTNIIILGHYVIEHIRK